MELPSVANFLLAELFSRQKKNSSYSRRAFARDIGLSPGFLSLLLNGAKSISENRAAKIAERLEWSGPKTRAFLSTVRCLSLQDTKEGALMARQLETEILKGKIPLFDIGGHHFQTISEWFHFAIVELSEVDDFNSSPEWIAARLDISVSQAREAIARLLTLGLLEHRDRRLVRGHNALYNVTGVASSAIRSFHSQHLAHAARALYNQDPAWREISGATIAINPEKMTLAKEMMREFLIQFNLAMEGGHKSRVYHLGLQFYALDSKPLRRKDRKARRSEAPAVLLPTSKRKL